ncbi:TIGR03546 family protein [Aliikangiella sp. IMCC44653]
MLTLLAKIFKALNSEQSPNQLALAVCLAAIVGLTPTLSLHNLFIVFVLLFFRINISIFLVTWPLFILLGLILEPFAQSLGANILQAPSLVPMWESFYNTAVGRWSNFYYTGVIGSLVVAIGILPILFPLVRYAVSKYRTTLLDKMEKYQIVRMLKASKVWQSYSSLTN